VNSFLTPVQCFEFALTVVELTVHLILNGVARLHLLLTSNALKVPDAFKDWPSASSLKAEALRSFLWV